MFPDRVKTIGIVAPAGVLSAETAERNRDFLHRAGFRTVAVSAVGKRLASLPYLAGSAAERAAELTRLWLDPQIDIIMCMRGGFGCAHLLPLLDWRLLATRPDMPLIGYSDVTALHFAMERYGAGVPVIAPMLGKLLEIADDEYTRREIMTAFMPEKEHVIEPVPGKEFVFLREGVFCGSVLAGNLTVAASLCGTEYLPSGEGKLIVLEDLNEPPYRIDRALTQLIQSTFFAGCGGIALGTFSDCGDERELREIFRRLLDCTAGPVLLNFPFGHTFPMTALNFRQRIKIGR